MNLGCGPGYGLLDVKVDGNIIHETSVSTSGRTPTDMGWETRRFEFTADGDTTRITFEAVDDAWCGPAIDAVSLAPHDDVPPPPTDDGTPTPEPPPEPEPAPGPDAPNDDEPNPGDSTTDTGGQPVYPLPTDGCVEPSFSAHELTVLSACIGYYGRPRDAPVMRAENLSDTALFTQPLLLAVANFGFAWARMSLSIR